MNHMLVRSAHCRWLLLAVAAVFLGVDSSRADAPLSVKAQRVRGDVLETPEDLNPPTDFTVAEEAPVVDFARVPLPATPANPWSIWGCGLLHSNGKFYVPLGDHRGVDANSYLYEYDPETKTLRQVADVQSAVQQFQPGDFGYGKIHGRLNEGPEGEIYFATYWGQWRHESDRYDGDRVLRYDPETEKLSDLGMPRFGWEYPSTHLDERHRLLYAEARKRKGNSRGNPSRY